MLDSIVKFTRRRAALALLCGLSVLALSGPVALSLIHI